MQFASGEHQYGWAGRITPGIMPFAPAGPASPLNELASLFKFAPGKFVEPCGFSSCVPIPSEVR